MMKISISVSALTLYVLSAPIIAVGLIPSRTLALEHPCLSASTEDYDVCLAIFGVSIQATGNTLDVSEEDIDALCNVYPAVQQHSCKDYYSFVYPALLEVLAPTKYTQPSPEEIVAQKREELRTQTMQAALLWMLCKDAYVTQDQCYQRLLPTLLRRSISDTQIRMLVKRQYK